jgi:hypothetical protein
MCGRISTANLSSNTLKAQFQIVWVTLLRFTDLPLEHDRLYLGDFVNCHGAVTEAKKTYPQSNGCKFCYEACHPS